MPRVLAAIVEDWCRTHGATFRALSSGWILTLSRSGDRRVVYGYDLGLNSSVTARVADDKNATWELLRDAGVAAVEHRIFHTPACPDFVGETGVWCDLHDCLRDFAGDAVCKPNGGSSGEGVVRVRTPRDLEQAAQEIFRLHRSLCLSPFYPQAEEFRVVVLQGECLLCFVKQRPAVTGDGRASIAELATRQGLAVPLPLAALAAVPAAGERVVLEWRHNLAQGGAAVLLPDDDARRGAVQALALAAAAALDLRFGSVDVLLSGGTCRVLEVNAGVMLERFARQSVAHRDIAFGVYARALDALVGSSP